MQNSVESTYCGLLGMCICATAMMLYMIKICPSVCLLHNMAVYLSIFHNCLFCNCVFQPFILFNIQSNWNLPKLMLVYAGIFRKSLIPFTDFLMYHLITCLPPSDNSEVLLGYQQTPRKTHLWILSWMRGLQWQQVCNNTFQAVEGALAHVT